MKDQEEALQLLADMFDHVALTSGDAVAASMLAWAVDVKLRVSCHAGKWYAHGEHHGARYAGIGDSFYQAVMSCASSMFDGRPAPPGHGYQYERKADPSAN